jgi:signal transduction histidine kinase
MKKQTAIFFYILGAYVVLQFVWWGYHLIELTEELKKEPTEIAKRITMIFGEGLVFFVILIFGLSKIRSSIIKELRLSERQNNFLLSVTHELKTPLAANKLYLQTIQKRKLDAQSQTDLLQKAVQENERLELMIDNILNASRIENKALQPIKEEKNLSEILRSVVDRFHRRYQKDFIVCEIEAEIVEQIDVFFIETILNNLIENAIKYGNIEKGITVYLFKKNREILFGVKDQGPGISKELRKQIFYKFFRAGNEETRMKKGSGLGLFIVSELVRIHNAKILYKENSPSGANFEITLNV